MAKLNTNNRTNKTSLILIFTGAFLLIGAVLMLLTQSRPTIDTRVTEPVIPTLSLDQVERISVDEAKRAYEEENAVILDIRSSGSYATEHIAGALNIPLDELDSRISTLNKDAWIIPYCT